MDLCSDNIAKNMLHAIFYYIFINLAMNLVQVFGLYNMVYKIPHP
jgi:hypothetical protein